MIIHSQRKLINWYLAIAEATSIETSPVCESLHVFKSWFRSGGRGVLFQCMEYDFSKLCQSHHAEGPYQEIWPVCHDGEVSVFCFTANLKESGNMTESEYQVLSNWFQYFLDCKEVDLSVDVILYLHVKAKFPITIIHVLLSDWPWGVSPVNEATEWQWRSKLCSWWNCRKNSYFLIKYFTLPK